MEIEIVNENGDSIRVSLDTTGDRHSTMLLIDGVRYHLDRVAGQQLTSDYQVDDDPNYSPTTDAEGYCYIIAPFSE